MTDRYVYDLSEGSAEMKPLLGGKGAGVAAVSYTHLTLPTIYSV